jgi:5-methylcytosine-specific restriction protein A
VEATQVDHIIPVSEGGGDELSNLQSTCDPCHEAKTQEEAQRARAKQSRKRPPMAHPTSGADGPVDWGAWGRAMGRG